MCPQFFGHSSVWFVAPYFQESLCFCPWYLVLLLCVRFGFEHCDYHMSVMIVMGKLHRSVSLYFSLHVGCFQVLFLWAFLSLLHPEWPTHRSMLDCLFLSCNCRLVFLLPFCCSGGLFKWPAFSFPSCTIPVPPSSFSGDWQQWFYFFISSFTVCFACFFFCKNCSHFLCMSLYLLFLSLDNVPQKMWILCASLPKSCCCWHSVFHFSYNYVELNPWALRPSCF